MHASPTEVETYLGSHLRLMGRGAERMASCPNPAAHSRGDKTPSFSVNLDKAVGHCHVCGLTGTITKIARDVGWGDPPWATNGQQRSTKRPDTWKGHPITCWYDYGPYAVARVEYEIDSQRRKEFPVWRDGWGLKGKDVTRRLYNQRALADAATFDVFVVEGEKDVETLKAHGVVAVSNLGGAGKWRDEDAAAFTADHHVAVLPDNDDAGHRHAETVAASLARRVASVKIVALPDLPPKGDVTDWLKAHPDADGALERLSQIVDGTEASIPPADADVLTFRHAHTLIEEPPPAEIIEGVAFAAGISVIAAESGTGKTFVATDMLGAVSAGVPWHGRAVEQGSVAYISFEGDALGLRLKALREVGGQKLEHVYVLRAADPPLASRRSRSRRDPVPRRDPGDPGP